MNNRNNFFRDRISIAVGQNPSKDLKAALKSEGFDVSSIRCVDGRWSIDVPDGCRTERYPSFVPIGWGDDYVTAGSLKIANNDRDVSVSFDGEILSEYKQNRKRF